MTSTQFNTIESVITDSAFAAIDVGLRAGRHYSLDGDILEYEFIQSAEDHLQELYRRYGCRLVQGPESYYYLISDGDLLGQRRLSMGEMLIGQTLALMRMDPAHLSRNGQIADEKLLGMLENVLGQDRLFSLMAPRSRGKDRETDARKIREETDRALNALQRLGFLRRILENEVRWCQPRPAVMRFADPVRESEDLAQNLRGLAARNEVSQDEDNSETSV
jgi:chromosome partition protein MukE